MRRGRGQGVVPRTMLARPRDTAVLPTLVLAAALTLLPASAGAAPVSKGTGKARLSVTRVSGLPGGAVAAGDTVKATTTVRNSGRRPGRSDVKLIVPRKVGAKTGKRLALKSDRHFGPHRKRSLNLRFTVPKGLAPNGAEGEASWEIAACVRRHGDGSRLRCRSATRPLVVKTPPLPPPFKPGGMSAGDQLFPQIGNTGYDAGHYSIDLAYNPTNNQFGAGTRSTMTATATQNLGRFSMDFQRLAISHVKVDGKPAQFRLADAKPKLAGATQPVKLDRHATRGHPEGLDVQGRRHLHGQARRDHRPGRLERGLGPRLHRRRDSRDLRRRPRRQRADRRRRLVPEQQRAVRQGLGPGRDHRAQAVRGARRRRAPEQGPGWRRRAALDMGRGRSDRDVPDDGDGRPLHLYGGPHDRDGDRPHPPHLRGDRLDRHAGPEDRPGRLLRANPVDDQLPRRPLRPLPLRFGRRHLRPGTDPRLRARGPDEAGVCLPRAQRRDHAARARAPVVRRLGLPRSVVRHLVQRGLGRVVDLVLGLHGERRDGQPRRHLRQQLRRRQGVGLVDRRRRRSTAIRPTCSPSSRPTYGRR